MQQSSILWGGTNTKGELMANFKRHKPKTYMFPSCPGGIKCCDASRSRTNNTKDRHTHKDYQQPQFYDDKGRYDKDYQGFWQA